MKKTMFITSVIMVVVMAIALTTSSLAWFSASSTSTVKTSAITIEAKAMTSTGLYIGRSTDAFQSADIALSDANGINTDLYPVVPYGNTANHEAADILYALQRARFIGNTTITVAGTSKWGSDGYSIAPSQYYTDTIYVANSGSTPTKVSASITIPADDKHGATLNVAVLARHESALLDKIQGDNGDGQGIINNGVIDGVIRVYTNAQYEEVTYNDYPYVGRVGIKSSGVYGEYIDEDGDGQITGEETTLVETFVTNLSLAANDEQYFTGYYSRLGETHLTGESSSDFANRDYAEANTNKWEILAYANGKGETNMYLGRYQDAKQLYVVTEENIDYYVLADGTKVLTTADISGYPERCFKDAADSYTGDKTKALLTTDIPGQNDFFEAGAMVSSAYDSVNPTQVINAKTSFVLNGSKRELVGNTSTLVEEKYGDYMEVVVFAWYSIDLSNSNSGAYDATNTPFGTSNNFYVSFTQASVN